VASLGRALETLGHTVFQMDTARHPSVLRAEPGARGGYGPVFVQSVGLHTVLEKFRPEILVFCAGGMVLTETDAADLRSRGIVTIGLTLSDPDVQESVLPYVANFDYHTTNAVRALEEYKARGIDNTLLFPFGIDRSFILQDVPNDETLAADAICIGHATGRPDRHEVMVALAKKVRVRTYGAGWPLPGSAPVSGDGLLQAAKAGTFHVNFPATRAGHTNVKCGVFESIGVGGVVCTTEFGEMANLFEYGTEIIGYQSADDLAATISSLSSDPEAVDSIRRRGFKRLIEDHLYEHRWNKLFDDIYRDLEGASPAVGVDRAREIRRILATPHGRPRVVLISGYYGAGNLGDDLLLESIATGVANAGSDVVPVVASVNPRYVESIQGWPAFLRTNQSEAERWASLASSVILGGGGLWHDYTIQKAGNVAGIVTGATLSPAHLVQLPLMVAAYGGSFHGFGLGVGPLEDPAARAVVNLSGRLAESITVRDADSARLLEGIEGWSTPVAVAPDAVYALKLPSLAEVGRDRAPYICVNIRPWRDDGALLEEVRRLVFSVALERGLAVVGLPMQGVDAKELAGWEPLAKAQGVDFRVASHDAPLEDILRVLAGARALVSMRLHANLLGHRLGVSCVGLSYDPKVRAHFEDLGRRDWVVDFASGADVSGLGALLDAAVEESTLPSSVLARLAERELAAAAALKTLGSRIINVPLRIPGTASMARTGSSQSAERTVRGTVRGVLGWPHEEGLDVRAARLLGGNLQDRTRKVGVKRTVRGMGVQFEMLERAPKQGDFALWALKVPCVPSEGIRVELWLKQKYGEKRQFAGRLAYEVIVDSEVLFRQDVTEWNPRNTVWIAKVPEQTELDIRVRLVALRDCEDWNWGKATSIVIEGARALPWNGGPGMVWGASSPAARALGIDAHEVEPKTDAPEQQAEPVLTTGQGHRAWRRGARRILSRWKTDK